MLNLIRLENKKFNIKGYTFKVIIANIIILAVISFSTIQSKVTNTNPIPSYKMLFMLSDAIIMVVFIVFASVIIANIIIEEYKAKTINVLFSYPINRKKLMVAKLIIVVAFTFLSIVLSNIFIDSSLCLVDSFFKLVPSDNITIPLLINSIIAVIPSALISAFIALIPLYFGMLKKSVPATISSAFIPVLMLANIPNNKASITSFIAASLLLSFIGILIAYLAIRNIDNKDLIN